MSELIERTNNKPKIIVLSGQPACGKTSLAKDLAWRDGYNVIYGSDEIREASDQMGITLESNRESYNAAWLEISRQRGRTWLAELAIARALESPGAKIVMESCRNPEDLYLLHQARLIGIIDVASIALDVPITMRFELSRKSDRERGATIEQFSQQLSQTALLQGNRLIQQLRQDLIQINAVNQELMVLDCLTKLITQVFEV